MTSTAFLGFLEIEEKLSVYLNPPIPVCQMENSEFPIIDSILIRNRSLLIHVTGEKPQDTMVNQMLNKVSWLFLGKNENAPDPNKIRGQIIVLREDEPDSLSYSLKSSINLHDTVAAAHPAYLRQLRPLDHAAVRRLLFGQHQLLRAHARKQLHQVQALHQHPRPQKEHRRCRDTRPQKQRRVDFERERHDRFRHQPRAELQGGRDGPKREPDCSALRPGGGPALARHRDRRVLRLQLQGTWK